LLLPSLTIQQCLFVDGWSSSRPLAEAFGPWGTVKVTKNLLSIFQIMLLTDPEVESSLLISSDEGATYQKYRLNFYILSLLFHPEQEDWILAYGHDQKVHNHSS